MGDNVNRQNWRVFDTPLAVLNFMDACDLVIVVILLEHTPTHTYTIENCLKYLPLIASHFSSSPLLD